MNPFRTVEILPSYALGFGFSWEIRPDFDKPSPWTFQVEEAETQDGPWTPLSPALVNTYGWAESAPRVAPKDPVLYFRVRMLAGGQFYYSHVAAPYGDLGRREFLIVRDIIRQELLQQRLLAGTPCQLWRKSVFGPRCADCTDFVTSEPTDAACRGCYGTGRVPGYHGPYPAWVTFTADHRRKHMTDNDQTGVKEPYANMGRIVGTVRVKKDDIVVDTAADRRYFVDDVQNLMEIRRYPVVQQATLNQIAVTHPVFNLR